MSNATEKWYRALLRDQERSGLSVLEFARRRGMPASNLYWWRKRLRKQEEATGGLVAVRVIEDPVGPARCEQGFELSLKDGQVLRIPSGFDESDLRRLLQVLDRPC